MSQTISTHDGDFHCDQILACYLIRKHIGEKSTIIIRTRDPDKIKTSDYVIGVGSVYNHSEHRYDYHQRNFNLTFKTLNPSNNTSNISFNVKLSCAGLTYHHYGREIIKQILELTDLSSTSSFNEQIETLFYVIYEKFVCEIDAAANGIPVCEEKPIFKINSDLSSRVARLRPNWTNQADDNFCTQRFSEAMTLVGNEFEDLVKYYGRVWLPARSFVKEALLNCEKVHSSGAIIDLSQSGGMPWIEHLISAERELNIEGQIKFAILYDISGIWRLSCVPLFYPLSEPRIAFHHKWHGLSHQNFCDITGVPGCICIHPHNGDFETKEACLGIAEKLIQLNSENHLNLNKSNSLSDESFYSLTENLSLEDKLHNQFICNLAQREFARNHFDLNEWLLKEMHDDNGGVAIGNTGDENYEVSGELFNQNQDLIIQGKDNFEYDAESREERQDILDPNNYNNENAYEDELTEQDANDNDNNNCAQNNNHDYNYDHETVKVGNSEIEEEYVINEEEVEVEEADEADEVEAEEDGVDGEEEEQDDEEIAVLNQSNFFSNTHLVTILENGCQLYHIPPPSLPPAEYHFCVVSALVDPSEFYIHLSNDDSSQLDDIQEQLSNHFAVDNFEEFELPDDPSLLVDSCWAAIYPTDNEWCRIKVIDLINSDGEAEEPDPGDDDDLRSQRILVKYIDYGTEEVINVEDLRPLPIDVINIPAFAVRCQLSHILPPPEGWSTDCLRYFEELSGIKVEQMVTVYVTERPVKNNYEEPLSVFLWHSDTVLGQGKDILVNAALVKASYAYTDSMDWVLEADAQSQEKTASEVEADKISVATCSKIKSSPIDLLSIKRSSSMSAIEEDIPDDWDPMTEDAKSFSNTYAFDPSDASSEIQEFKDEDLTGICQHFIKGHCESGANCVYKHLTPSQIEALDSEEVLIDPFETELVQEGMNLDVTVTCCLSPYSFYVTPAMDIIWSKTHESRVGQIFEFTDPTRENYHILNQDMVKFYRRPENQENLSALPALGSLIAVKGGQGFYRARVIDIWPDEDEVLVMDIDTGIEAMVDRREVYTLRPKFATLPAFAIHCALDVPPGLCVTDKVMNSFSNMVLDKTFKAQFVEKDLEGRFIVTLFHLDGQKVTIAQDNFHES